jgi:hypothetical protein
MAAGAVGVEQPDGTGSLFAFPTEGLGSNSVDIYDPLLVRCRLAQSP